MADNVVLHVWKGDEPKDGLVAEWIGAKIRFGLWIERDPPEVSWTLVSVGAHDYFEGDVLPLEMVKDLADALNAVIGSLSLEDK